MVLQTHFTLHLTGQEHARPSLSNGEFQVTSQEDMLVSFILNKWTVLFSTSTTDSTCLCLPSILTPDFLELLKVLISWWVLSEMALFWLQLPDPFPSMLQDTAGCWHDVQGFLISQGKEGSSHSPQKARITKNVTTLLGTALGLV